MAFYYIVEVTCGSGALIRIYKNNKRISTVLGTTRGHNIWQYSSILCRHLAFEKVFDEEEWWWDGMGVDKVPEDAR